MGTRGLYGFRKDGVDKITYNHNDSYPDYLGYNVVDFCINTTRDIMVQIFDNIEMVDENSVPTETQINYCKENGYYNSGVSAGNEKDWYCLLRNTQGDFDILKDFSQRKGYIIDNRDFIKDSLFCEYAYIINLDTDKLEFYVGFQKEPQKGNRYGEDINDNGYYPCKLTYEFPLKDLRDHISSDMAVDIMKKLEL